MTEAETRKLVKGSFADVSTRVYDWKMELHDLAGTDTRITASEIMFHKSGTERIVNVPFEKAAAALKGSEDWIRVEQRGDEVYLVRV